MIKATFLLTHNYFIVKNFLRITAIVLFSFTLFAISAPIVGQEIGLAFSGLTFASAFVPKPTGILGMNSMEARMVFDNASKAISKAFSDKPDILRQVKLTQGFLRVSQALVVGQTLYQFPILVNETQLGIFNTETRLNQQDSFVLSELGIFVSAPASAADATYRLQTYPNTQVFTGANAAALQSIYNGSLSLTINNDILIPKWDLFRHLVINETQQTAALGAGSPNDKIIGAIDGFYPVEPNIVFIGSKNNVLQVQLPVGVTAIQANSRIEILMRGVVAQNSTVVS